MNDRKIGFVTKFLFTHILCSKNFNDNYRLLRRLYYLGRLYHYHVINVYYIYKECVCINEDKNVFYRLSNQGFRVFGTLRCTLQSHYSIPQIPN